jgi:hypothetical protein
MNEYAYLFARNEEPALVEIPSLPYLMVDGKGAPDSPEYSNAVAALYTVAYAVRAALKPEVQYSVLPLQGQWWSPDPAVFSTGDRSAWCWTMMILQPPQATAELVAEAIDTAAQKKTAQHRPVRDVRFEVFTEGTCAQILHKGPYSEEPATLARLMDFMRRQGRQITGNHHEIYLTRPRTDAPEKMRTLIRYPV